MEMNQSRADIVILIPIAMVVTIYTGKPTTLQDIQEHEKIAFVASFYPLYEFAPKVVGNRVEVSSLVPSGVEPHDWDPTAEDISRERGANIVIINGAGFGRWTKYAGAKVVVYTSEGIELNTKEEPEAKNERLEQEGKWI